MFFWRRQLKLNLTALPLCTGAILPQVRPPVSRPFAGVNLTKIVATIGPASEDAETLPKIVEAGMNVMRLNFSHATDEEVTLRMNSLKLSAGSFPLDGTGGEDLRAILLDTKGPEIRTGNLQAVIDTGDVKAKVSVKTGDEIILTHDESRKETSDAKVMYVTYPSLSSTAEVGGTPAPPHKMAPWGRGQTSPGR